MKVKIDTNKAFSIVFTGIGLLAIIIGLLVFIGSQVKLNRLKTTGFKTEAIISSIHRSRDNESTTVFVTFMTLDGREITTELNYYSSGMYTGQSIELYYDPNNPGKVMVDSKFFIVFPLAFIGCGSIFFIIGIVFIKKGHDFKKKKNMLISAGYSVWADIIDFSQNINISVNGRHPFIIHAQYSENDREYNFKSHDVWLNPAPFLNSKVRVYLDRHDYTVYYVDVESLNRGLS